MLLLASLLVLVPLGISLVVGSTHVAAVTSLIVAALSWALIARFTYLQPIPLNEPEWWAGLAIICTLALAGVVVGSFVRRRQIRWLSHSQQS